MATRVTGFECEFVGEAPRRSDCPICLLVLCEPHQATCCGKNFRKTCISEIKTRRQPCPACKEKNFDCYPDRGLEQELYSAHVFCSNRREGCEWQGELRELDHHLNVDPTEEKQLVGCGQAKVKCLHCPEIYKRAIMKRHQDSECPLRPTTCDLCKVFKSTYEEVTDHHKPECKCRLVACPNSCGVANLQHQHLEEHKFRQCPLSLVECEFSDAGCEVKVLRQDLPSHLREEVVNHLSLLASENRRLKTQLQEQDKEMKRQLQEQDKEMKKQLQEQDKETKRQLQEQLQEQDKETKRQLLENDKETKRQLREQDKEIKRLLQKQDEEMRRQLQEQDEMLQVVGVPPLDILFTENEMSCGCWSSQPFYSHNGGYKLKLKLEQSYHSSDIIVKYILVDPAQLNKLKLHISSEIIVERKLVMDKKIVMEHELSSGETRQVRGGLPALNDTDVIRINKITVIKD